jgi:hypothetical protein
MEQVCSALDFAHQRNVVHRDIKPANLMLTADDTVKITDFGTAKILQFGTAQTSHVMGTPSYMSPEQVKGKPVDGRSDIFSLGVILYELMTGEKPFPGQNITTVIYKIINEEPIPPRSLDSSIHPGLSAVITHALAKEPTARFQNCAELLDALKNYHDIVSPEATVRMSPASGPAAGGGLAAAPPLRAPSAPSNARSNTADAPVRRVPTFIEEDHRTARKRGSFLLCLVLLGIIGYAGYRVWPQMLDIWQRMHEPGEALATLPKTLPVTPPANSAAPETKPDDSSQAPPLAQKTAPAVAKVNPAPPQSSAPKLSARLPEPLAAPAAAVEKAIPPQKPAVPAVAPAANLLKSTLESQLADLPLAGKVKMQVTGNTLTLSGQLTSREHSELLNHLHNVPAGVRVIDDIGYAGELNGTSDAAEVGWVWIRSMPRGAEIFVDGTDTGLRAPARVEMQPGEHEVLLTLRGFGSTRREVSIRPGQNMQFTELLGKP